MAAVPSFKSPNFLIFFIFLKLISPNNCAPTKPNVLFCTGRHELLVDGWFQRTYEPILLRHVTFYRKKLGSNLKIQFAVFKNGKHGVTSLALPQKPFKIDLTISMDISPNPGPDLGTSRSTENQYRATPRLNSITTHYYSSSELLSFRKYESTRHLPLEMISSLKEHRLLRTRGSRGGNLVRLKRMKIKSIPVIIRQRPSETNSFAYYKQSHRKSTKTSAYAHRPRTIIPVKLDNTAGPTPPKVIPKCMVINARSLAKPGATSALYADLHSK